MRTTFFKSVCFCLLLVVDTLFFPNTAFGYPGDAINQTHNLKNAIGIAIGVPQTLALTYERSLGSNSSASIHIGSVVLVSSGGARVLWRFRQKCFRPYLFAGVVFIHSVAEGYGDPEGISSYIWLGPGLSLQINQWIFYAEVCALLGGDDDSGLGDDWIFPFSPVIAGGVMIHLF